MFTSRIHPVILIGSLLCCVLIYLDRVAQLPSTHALTLWLYETTVVLGAVALLLGVVNVINIHIRRIHSGEREWSLSVLLVLALLGTWVAGLVDANGIFSPIVNWLFERLIAPGQAALFALLPFFLAVAAWRYLRIDWRGGGWMLAGALLMLLMQMPAGSNSILNDYDQWMGWLVAGSISAVMRGVLLGGALTMVVAGLRLLLGRR